MALFIELSNGTKWSFDKEENEISPVVLASSLSKLCRFTGHCSDFYSVAEHSVHASYLAPKGFELEALLHDAHESITNDLSKPFKTAIGGSYEEWEDNIERYVRTLYGLAPTISPEVKQVDRYMVFIEAYHLMPSKGEWYNSVADHMEVRDKALELMEEYSIKPKCWSPLVAEYEFLMRYRELFDV